MPGKRVKGVAFGNDFIVGTLRRRKTEGKSSKFLGFEEVIRRTDPSNLQCCVLGRGRKGLTGDVHGNLPKRVDETCFLQNNKFL